MFLFECVVSVFKLVRQNQALLVDMVLSQAASGASVAFLFGSFIPANPAIIHLVDSILIRRNLSAG